MDEGNRLINDCTALIEFSSGIILPVESWIHFFNNVLLTIYLLYGLHARFLGCSQIDYLPVKWIIGMIPQDFVRRIPSHIRSINVDSGSSLEITKLHEIWVVFTIRQGCWANNERAMLNGPKRALLSFVVAEDVSNVVLNEPSHSQPDLDFGWSCTMTGNDKRLDVLKLWLLEHSHQGLCRDCASVCLFEAVTVSDSNDDTLSVGGLYGLLQVV
mmetsp:Transcript_4839/g.8400  ORF Transcript_4839/g.8400 Transcript_4839/m.8400 type:complete len:214 (+) Transcript_4839:477-1118(+)